MIERDDSHLLVGTDAGLYLMNTQEETFTKLIVQTSDNESVTTAVNAIYEDDKGNIWIGTMFQGIFMYNTDRNEIKKIELSNYDLRLNATWSIFEDSRGTIWIGTRLGLLRFNINSGKLDPVEGIFSFSDSSVHEILYIFEDSNSNLWLGTWSEGLRLFDRKTNKYTTYLGTADKNHYVTHIRSIFQYDDNNIFIGSDDGLYLFDLDSRNAVRTDIPHMLHSLSDQNVYSIAKDRENGIWIGTYFGGVNYLNPAMTNIETYYPNVIPGTLSGKAVSQFCEDDAGNLWIATEDGGLNYFNTKTKIITQPIQTTYHNTHALMWDKDDLWIGTFSRGIDVYNIKTKHLSNYRSKANDSHTINDDCIFSLYKTKNGDIYAGTPVGLNKFDRKTRNFNRIEEVSGFIYDIEEDENGNIWIAAYGSGAMKFDYKNDKWVHYDTIQNKANPIIGSKLTGIHIDSQKRILFTSEGRGIFIYDQHADRFRNISETEGLPNNVTYGILDDSEGNWWVSSNKGIFYFDPTNLENFKLLNKEDGLQSNQFNYKSSYKARNGKFYFGGINGFSSFYPQNLIKTKNTTIPPVEITGIHILGNEDKKYEYEIQQRLNNKQKIKLPYNKSSFTISYVSLSYIAQVKNQYAYKLEGADTEWNHVGNNKSVTYVNMATGNYKFKIKASNNDGIWNETGSEIEIEILPPFWLSLPAKLIYFIILIILIYGAFWYYRKKDTMRQRQQLEAFKTEQETLSFKSKIDFFTTIAHEIRTPLSLITAPLEEVINSKEGNEQTKQNLSIIEKNTNRLKVLINQLLDFRKMDSTRYIVNPEQINIYDHIYELYDRFKKTAQKKHVNLILELPEDKNLLVYSDADALTKIIGNLLTNALKYTRDKIILSLTRSNNDTYTVKVEDNGRGISDYHKGLIFDPFYQVQSGDGKIGTGLGLSLVKNLTDVLRGTIKVVDSETGGSAFIFTFSSIQPEQKEKSIQDKPENDLSKNYKDNRVSILVVEDNADMASFIETSLQNEYHVNKALNAEEALKLLDENSYDIIISDIMMPGIDGISFTKKIKADINYNHIPVILLSAKTENAVKIEGLLSGADVFIEKPFSVSFLKAQIISLLENRKSVLDAFNRSPLASYSTLVNNKQDEIFLNRLNEKIEEHIADENFSVESLAEIFNMSRSNLQRKLKNISGVTPGDYLRNYRLKKASKLLLESDMRINEVAFSVGFNSASYFTKVFQKTYNMLPKEFVNKFMNNNQDRKE